MSTEPASSAAAAPVFRVAKGRPSEAELAAVMAVLQIAMSPRVEVDDVGDRPRAGGWKSYWRVVRRPIVPGRDGWKGAVR